MDKLTDKALIERIACPNDRRVVHINITSKGLNLLAEIDKENDKHDFINNLNEDEAAKLSELLDKLRDTK
jgi:DNA-binding MarR family transcriptional regulator